MRAFAAAAMAAWCNAYYRGQVSPDDLAGALASAGMQSLRIDGHAEPPVVGLAVIRDRVARGQPSEHEDLPGAPSPVSVRLLLPTSGQVAGLTGPVEFTRAAVASEMALVVHAGTGHGRTWMGVVPAAGGVWVARTLASDPVAAGHWPTLAQARSTFLTTTAQAAAQLSTSGVAPDDDAHDRLDRARDRPPPVLPPRWSPAARDLLTRAAFTAELTGTARAARPDKRQDKPPSGDRNHQLSRVRRAALDAMAAAASDPAAIG